MSSLQDKLYNYEQAPPEKAWDKIAAALDESHIADEFPSRLYDAEAIPPANAWDKIVNALEPEHASAIPLRQKRFSFYQYAAAAIFIGIITLGIVKWINGNTDKSGERMVNVPGSTTKKNADLADKKNNTEPNRQSENRITDERANDIAGTDMEEIKTVSRKKVKSNYSAANNPDAVEAIYAYNEHTPNLADRYIMLMTPDGGIIRMSKKWENLVCCVSGQEQDPDCKDQLKKWQEKLACSPVATSNFMDIFSLISTLNDTEL